MGSGQAVETCLHRFARFSGRACRAEFRWFAALFAGVAMVVAPVERALTGADYLSAASLLTLTMPLIAGACRRLRDRGRRAWWLRPPAATLAATSVAAWLLQPASDFAVATGIHVRFGGGHGEGSPVVSAVLATLIATGWLLASLARPGTGGPNAVDPSAGGIRRA